MKRILHFLFFLLPFSFLAQTSNAALELRKMYYAAATEENANELFLDKLEELDKGNNAILGGYHGMAYMLKAKFAWNPYNKVAHFKKGKKLLESAISADKNNTELRFLRYCVQSNAPVFLGYSGQIAEDKALIISGYQQLKDEDLKKRIKDFMKDSSKCTAEEKNKFN